MIITVIFSFFEAPLIIFNNDIGYLTSLLFVSTAPDDESERKFYFYLEFMPMLKNNQEDQNCAEAVYNYEAHKHICDILKRASFSNSLLVGSLFLGIISCIITIVLVVKMFKGAYFRFVNLLMLSSSILFLVMTIVWWLVTDD